MIGRDSNSDLELFLTQQEMRKLLTSVVRGKGLIEGKIQPLTISLTTKTTHTSEKKHNNTLNLHLYEPDYVRLTKNGETETRFGLGYKLYLYNIGELNDTDKRLYDLWLIQHLELIK